LNLPKALQKKLRIKSLLPIGRNIGKKRLAAFQKTSAQIREMFRPIGRQRLKFGKRVLHTFAVFFSKA
jgi:hypothetical protein